MKARTKLSVKKQIEIYGALNCRHTVTSTKVGDLTFDQILMVANIIKNESKN